MPTDEATVKNWGEFLKYVERFIPQRGNPYGSMGFRGQERHCSTWKLQPSLARQLPTGCSLEECLESRGLC